MQVVQCETSKLGQEDYIFNYNNFCGITTVDGDRADH